MPNMGRQLTSAQLRISRKRRSDHCRISSGILGNVCLSSKSAVAQNATDLGQQGEFEGEHVDTGTAALDTGPEMAEGPELGEATEATKSMELSPSTVGTTVTHAAASVPAAATVQGAGSTQDLNVE
jgi:hypothetical protein